MARTAEEMAAPAVLFAVVAEQSSPSAGALAAASLAAASAVAGPFLGAVLDAATSAVHVTAAAMAWMALWLAATATLASGPVALVAGLAFLAGLAGPALTGGWTAQLADVVPPHALPRVTAVDAATYNVAGIAGPALAGLLASTYGARIGVFGAAVALLLAVPAALSVRVRRRVQPTARGASQPGARDGWDQLWRGMGRACAQLIRNRSLSYVTVVSTTGYAGLGAALIAAQLLGVEYGGGVGAGGFLIAALAVGGLAGTALMALWPARWRLEVAVTGSSLSVGLAFLGLSMPSSLAVAAFFFVVAGVGDGVLLSATLAVRHREAVPELRAQLFTTAASLKIAAYAVGLAVAGATVSDGRAGAFAAGAAHVVAVGAGAVVAARTGRSRSVATTAGP